MRRRVFITLLGGTATWSLVASAQQAPRMPRVVLLAPADIPAQHDLIRRLLRDLGYVEGHNIRLEFRSAAGNVDALPAVAQEIVRDGGVDAILAISTLAARAAYKATQTIPIIAFAAIDPVRSGLADSLAHPGRNVTGITVFAEETSGKLVELMREVVPRAVRLGTVTSKLSSGAPWFAPVLDAGRRLGFTVEPIIVDDPADLAKALSPEVLAGFDALVLIPDAVLSAHMAEVIKMVGLSNKPAIFPSPDWVANGGFMSFGPDYVDAERYLILQLDRILKGARPADLPFERPTKFDLRINLRIAKELGIELSPTLLARADEVIE
jgi:putative ABC transport system substrate-binding protein